MKFGLAYSFQNPKGSGKTHAELYKEGLRQAELADRLGFDYIVLVEHHFLEDGMNPSLLPTAAAMAARTERVRIATCCYLLSLHHPIETAENAAVVDNISNGRLTLGVAAAYRDEEFRGFGYDRKDRGARTDEYLTIVNDAWTKDTFTFKGKFYSCENLSVTPKPVQRPIPIWFGASGSAGLERAASRGIPLVGSNRHHINDLEQQYADYRAFLSKYGKQVNEVPLLRNVYVAESDEKAAEESGESMMGIFGLYGKWSEWRKMTDDKGRSADDPRFFEFRSHAEKAILGSPKTVTDQVEMYRKRLGVSHLLCWIALPGMPSDKVENSIRLLARDVIPAFR
jgi:alkanesulfonate monooxygenase SsuD/methylene tetrahydromethanopterin reductase-like flavin-dependent oxidoreductase (luciferase family)